MRTSESIKAIAPALLAAQKAIGPAIKDKTNPLYKSKYADLHAVLKACLDALNANGLVLLQTPVHSEDGKVHMTTRLQHESGEYMEETFSIPAQKQDPHGYGSACTYLRRFSVSAWLGIVTEEDDDGNAAIKSPADKVLTRKSDARTFTVEALEAMGPEEQAFLQAEAIKVIDAHENGQAADYVKSLKLDSEEKMALWSLLPSNVRAAIKKAPTPTELASQP
jgi:hypothetical protein